MPALVLDASAVAEIEARDRELARAAGDDASLGTLRRLYLDWGAAEAGGGESHSVSRRDAIGAAVSSVLTHAGPEAIRGLRAEFLLRLPGALEGRDDETEDAALLGAFPRMLARYEVAREGRVVGPAFVVRVLYAARFNMILGLAPTSDFSPVEARAYWGWLALGTTSVSPVRRMEALDRYGQAGGGRALEARAALLYALGQGTQSSALYEEAYRKTGNMRLRNHAMAAGLLGP
jgi:hypothetical protein